MSRSDHIFPEVQITQTLRKIGHVYIMFCSSHLDDYYCCYYYWHPSKYNLWSELFLVITQKTNAARADEEVEDEDDDMRAQENQKILDEINECKEKNNGIFYCF